MRRTRDRGMTIVELLITLIVASLVAGATFTFFAGQQKIYDVQTDILNLQQNLWASMETLARYTRASGAGMHSCVREVDGADPGDPVPGGAVSPDTGLRVWRDGVFSRIPPLWIQNGAAGAPDTITIAYGEGASGSFRNASLLTTIPAGQSTNPINLLPGQARSFLPDEFALLVQGNRADNDVGCTLFQITNVDFGADRLDHIAADSIWNTAANTAQMVPWDFIGNADPTLATGGVRSFGTLRYVQFAVDTVANPPTLTMNILTEAQGPQVLAEGIEDMQIAYACDLQPAVPGPDGVLSEGTDAATRAADEWTYNVAGDVPPNACKRPAAVRITLMARALNADGTLSDLPGNAKVAAEDGNAGAADLFRHRVAAVTVYPRN
jgi:prepilin-type N-terminal cleavage/methylation domain-containing protein